MPRLRWLLVMESRSEPESAGPRYRLWLTPLDETDARSVSATSFATADELLQALFARWDRHFRSASPDGESSRLSLGQDEP